METSHFHRLADFNTVKMSMLPSVINIQCRSYQNSEIFFILTEIEKYTCKVNMESKGSQIVKEILNKNKARRLTYNDFKTYYKATVKKKKIMVLT